jgi:hypothetical protein
VLEVDGSQVKMHIEQDTTGTFWWSWPRISSPSFPTMGEELAQALSLIDGTFSVVPRRPERVGR